MVVRVDVAGDVLQWAVERAGWDEETVARRAPRLDEWIIGTQKPTLKQIEKFASDTHTPFGALFLPEPPVEDVPIPDMRTIGNLAVPRPSVDLLETIYLCQNRQAWYRAYAEDNGLPAPEFVGSATTDTSANLVAAEMRHLLKFELPDRSTFSSWQQALRRLIDRIENLGVLVMVSGIVGGNTHRKLNPDEFRGFALSDPQAPLIFVNGADTKAAQIFSMVHEFAHIWLGGSALSDATMTAREGETAELWCNEVAAEVLVPLAALRTDFQGTVTVEELERLASRYRVSTLVVLSRIHDASLMTWEDYRDTFERERERVMAILEAKGGDAGGGNYYYTQPLRLSRRFAQAVVSSTFEGSTSYRDAYRLLGTKKHATFEGLATELGVS
ncbi:ImmA/IrrE family metallo-endopeptidase [Ornithinimicrobium panacihumi]|uniref:ImmA/IrrE family metallo-endopeptidase n=1 Tax=Ornithinimicrobium panacihumi TaxID=2008449 RepID=UPI003F8901B6